MKMYCSSCGVAVKQGLSYCNYCGAKVGGTNSANEGPEVKPEFLVAAMVGTFIFGLVAITILMGVLKNVLNFNVSQILFFALLSFLIMLLLEGVFLRLLMRRKGNVPTPGVSEQLRGPATKELEATEARGLPQSAPSVTENTTRTLEPVYNDRRPK